MSRIFINYRRQDTEGYVGRLYDHLAQHFDPRDIFMDVDSIPPGADFVQVLEEAVSGCDVLIAMIGPQWTTINDENGQRRLDHWNDFVRIEIASALRQNKLVIPVLVGRARMPSPDQLPDDLKLLARRNAFELGHQSFIFDVEKLVRAIKEAVPVNASFKSRTDLATLQRKGAALRLVRNDLLGATESPLYNARDENRWFPVFGEGNPDANLMFIAEAPRPREAGVGRPFAGPAGEVLTEMLKSINLSREDVFITNLVLDCPPEKRDPLPKEVEFYAPFVDRIIDIVQPAIIAPLGGFAMTQLLRKFGLTDMLGTITQVHGKLMKTQLPYGEVHIIPFFHPGVVLYSATQKEALLKDFQKLKLFI